MSLYNQVARLALSPAMDHLRGTHTMKHLQELEQSQWWPAERLVELQSERLRRLLLHAYEHVPYYRRVMDERGLKPAAIGCAEDLHNLPLLTKGIIRDAGPALLADDFTRSALREMSTSGSTGETLHFYSTAEDQFSRGLSRSLRALGWAGIRIGDRHARLSRPRRYATKQDQFLHDLSQRLRRSKVISYGALTDDDLSLVVRQLSHGKFSSIGGSPPLLRLVAEFARARHLTVPPVDTIVCGGEQLFPHERRLLRETWGPEPHSKYSSFEVYDIAGECNAHAGLHIQSEDVIVEILDDRGTPVPNGHIGHIYLTNLHSHAMPFVRYAIGDMGAIDFRPCSCDRNLPRLVGMVGRTSELIVTRSGRRIFAADLDLESFASLGVARYRLVQEDVDSVVACVVWHSDIDAATRTEREPQLVERLRRSMKGEINVILQSVERIEPTAEGKHMVVISKLTPRIPPNTGSSDATVNRTSGDYQNQPM
ncbi:MAG: phenylacetate--CoA ligase family protein [Dehalococcoidia bacterium]|nr:phenylacetate--CoA ligase family protein [Dehalococcoidia bacterium]